MRVPRIPFSGVYIVLPARESGEMNCETEGVEVDDWIAER